MLANLDLLIALDVAVGHEELDLPEGLEHLLALGKVTEQEPLQRQKELKVKR